MATTKKPKVFPSIKVTEDCHQTLTASLASMTEDYDKFLNKGVVASGRRMRKALQDIRKTAATMRKAIQEQVNHIKGK